MTLLAAVAHSVTFDRYIGRRCAEASASSGDCARKVQVFCVSPWFCWVLQFAKSKIPYHEARPLPLEIQKLHVGVLPDEFFSLLGHSGAGRVELDP